MDISKIKEPVEVWKAVNSQPEDLINLLRSNALLSEWYREALALYFEGKLIPIKRPNHRARKIQSPVEKVVWTPKMELLEVLYKKISKRSRKYKKSKRVDKYKCSYGKSGEIIEALANKHGVHPQTLKNYLRRSKKKLNIETKLVEQLDDHQRVIRHFQKWYEENVRT